MKRKIISVNEDLCTGCGACIPNCPEGALQIIDGKARLVSDLFCDGLGACIGECPTGAMRIEEREAAQYDERVVMNNIIPQGINVIKAHLKHLQDHGETGYYTTACEVLNEKNIVIKSEEISSIHSGCPGSKMIDLRKKNTESAENKSPMPQQSELGQWPVQLGLINPVASYFDADELLVAADCVPFAYGNFHSRFLKDRPLVIFCPKLDQTLDRYIDKIAQILKQHPIKRVGIVRMEVPCCGGTTAIVEQAIMRAEKNIPIREYIISINGEIV